MSKFPLDQWFDVTKPIDKSDMELTAAQMTLYAVIDNLDPESPEVKKEISKMYRACKAHNKRLREES